MSCRTPPLDQFYNQDTLQLFDRMSLLMGFYYIKEFKIQLEFNNIVIKHSFVWEIEECSVNVDLRQHKKIYKCVGESSF